jgi:hypothetical protein
MKRFIILLLLIPLLSGLNSLKAQKYISKRQSYFTKSSTEDKYLNQTRTVFINSNKFEIELLDKSILKGTLTPLPTEYKNGKKIKAYKTDKGCILAIYPGLVFLNLFATDSIAITYYFDNYVEPTSDEKQKTEDEVEYNVNVKMYGKFTADCIKEGKVKPGMDEVAALLMLGTPNTINQTETVNGMSEQFVYDDMFVYFENGKLTAIQRKIDIKK